MDTFSAAAGQTPGGGAVLSGKCPTSQTSPTAGSMPPPHRPLRICHVITRMIIGGAQENTLLSVRGLMDRGHQVTLLTGPTTGPEGSLFDTEDIDGMTIVQEPALIRPVAPIRDVRAYRRLLAFFQEQRFDVVHTHSSKAGILGRMAAWKARVPLVVHTVHGQAFHSYQSWLTNRFYILAERFAAKRCHHICAVAQAMIDQCVAANVAPPEKYSVCYSGMNLKPYLEQKPDCELRKSLGIPPDSPVVGKVARLFELKGHDFLLQAAPAVVAKHPNVRFLLVGDGNLRESLERQVAELGLTENFVFAGLVPPSDIPRYMSIMDCLVHLSLREGLPRTVVQAFASGIPAVAFALDGTPEVVQHDATGYLCNPGDAQAVTGFIDDLLAHPEKRRSMGEQGRRLVVSRFDWQRMVATLDALYRWRRMDYVNAKQKESIMSKNLAAKECKACQGGQPPLKGDKLNELKKQLETGWEVVEEHHLEKTYKFDDFQQALDFTNRVGQVAEEQGHHPDIYLTYGKVRLSVWTHKSDGMTESDFIFAAKVDQA